MHNFFTFIFYSIYIPTNNPIYFFIFTPQVKITPKAAATHRGRFFAILLENWFHNESG